MDAAGETWWILAQNEFAGMQADVTKTAVRETQKALVSELSPPTAASEKVVNIMGLSSCCTVY